VSTIEEQARKTEGALPLITYALERLYNQGDTQQGLTLQTYEKLGGIRGCIETLAKEMDEQLDLDPAYAKACETFIQRAGGSGKRCRHTPWC